MTPEQVPQQEIRLPLVDEDEPRTCHPVITMPPNDYLTHHFRLTEPLQVRCLGCGFTTLYGIHIGPKCFDHGFDEEWIDDVDEEFGQQPPRAWVAIIELAHCINPDGSSHDGVHLRAAALAFETMKDARAHLAKMRELPCPREEDPNYALTCGIRVPAESLWPYPYGPAGVLSEGCGRNVTHRWDAFRSDAYLTLQRLMIEVDAWFGEHCAEGERPEIAREVAVTLGRLEARYKGLKQEEEEKAASR